MFGIFKRRKIPPRHRSAAYMNLAFGRPVTKSGTWNTAPVGYECLTKGDVFTAMATAGIDNTGTDAYIEIDLGAEYEIYEINVHSGVTGGFKSAASNTGKIELKVLDALANVSTLADQTTVSTAYIPIAIDYVGNGIPVQKIRLVMTPDGTRPLNIKPSEIEVFGC